MKTIFLILLLVAGLLGCGEQQQPRHIVILPDVSGSIERDSLEQAFKAIGEMVSHLHRGDRIAIIPILGDAQAEASGRIIRFEVPKERQAYNADLRDFRRKLGISLAEMQANAAAHPGSKTDILGSIELAEQEFEYSSTQESRLLLILSDFIQEDSNIDFRRNSWFANQLIGSQFAAKAVKNCTGDLDGVRVYLGFLRSNEYAALSPMRRLAIQSFWITYFKFLHSQPTLANDGPGFVATLSH